MATEVILVFYECAEYDEKLLPVVGVGEQAEIGRHLEKMAVFYEFMLVNPQLMLHWQILFYTKLKIIKFSIKKGITILFLIDAVWRKSAFPSGYCL